MGGSLRAQENADPDVRVVCPEETKARLFWKKHCLYDMSLRRGHQMKLVFVGFGRLGEEALLQGLQNNIFDPEQRIEYHIFGDGDGFWRFTTRCRRYRTQWCSTAGRGMETLPFWRRPRWWWFSLRRTS